MLMAGHDDFKHFWLICLQSRQCNL